MTCGHASTVINRTVQNSANGFPCPVMSCWRAKNRAVVLVIDKSGSMRDDDRIIYAPFLRAVSPERMAGTLKMRQSRFLMLR